MPQIKINKDRCKGCQICVINCPKGLLQQDRNFNVRGVQAVIFQDNSDCTGCRFCALVCPEVCIEVYK